MRKSSQTVNSKRLNRLQLQIPTISQSDSINNLKNVDEITLLDIYVVFVLYCMIQFGF